MPKIYATINFAVPPRASSSTHTESPPGPIEHDASIICDQGGTTGEWNYWQV